MIIGSMAFIKNMISLKNKLEKLGHKASIPYGTEPHQNDSNFVESLKANLEYCIQNNVMKSNFDMVTEHDAVLVVNKKRKGVKGYVGVSALMEMAIAHHFDKKIFVLHKIPHYNKVRWAHEVMIMQPKFINSNLTKIA